MLAKTRAASHQADDRSPPPAHILPPHPHHNGNQQPQQQHHHYRRVDSLRQFVFRTQRLVVARPLFRNLQILSSVARDLAPARSTSTRYVAPFTSKSRNFHVYVRSTRCGGVSVGLIDIFERAEIAMHPLRRNTPRHFHRIGVGDRPAAQHLPPGSCAKPATSPAGVTLARNESLAAAQTTAATSATTAPATRKAGWLSPTPIRVRETSWPRRHRKNWLYCGTPRFLSPCAARNRSAIAPASSRFTRKSIEASGNAR